MISRRWYTISRRLTSTSVPARNTVTSAEEKISRLPNGLTIASVDLGGPIAQLVVAYRAGTRYEMPNEAGLVHHIRNCVGGDSQRYYGAQLLWQCGSAGATVNALMTRDLFGVQMSVIRDRAAVGLSLLGELAQPAFKPWDVEDFKQTLNIDRSYLKPYDVLMEDMHDNSQMVTGNAVLVGVNIPHDQILDYASSQFTLPEGSSNSPKPSPYCGGEKRHKTLMKDAHVVIAGKGASLRNFKSLAVQAVLSAAIGQGAATKYAVGVGQGAVTKAVFKASSGYPFGISAISEVYTDEGLVGVYIVAEADHIGPLCNAAIKAVKSFKLDDSALQVAKNIAAINVLNRAESSENMALDRAAQILATGKTETISDLLRGIASVTMDDITKFTCEEKNQFEVYCSALVLFHGEQPTWDSIDSRPIPQWYQHAKLGIFCHWGVYSVPAVYSEWLWYAWKISNRSDIIRYMNKNYKPGVSYADFAKDFTAEHFNASMFRDIVEASGARQAHELRKNPLECRYFVLTSKHHEGFTMWPSATSWNWNSVDVGAHRDIVGELKNAFLESKVRFGLYFSQYEWFNRYYINDRKYNTTDYVKYVSYPQMLEIVRNYEPQIIWSDGDWEMSDDYWKSKEFIAWLYNSSPVKDTVVVNDRWGAGVSGKHGGFLTYSDHFDPGYLIKRKWENCLTLDKKSWGYRRNMRSGDVNTVSYIISQLVRTIACNGNLLLNIGPDKSGMIAPIFEDRLRELGKWVKRNREAIFDTYPWMYQNDSLHIWYTISLPSEYRVEHDTAWVSHAENSILYAFFLEFPLSDTVRLPSVHYTPTLTAEILLGYGKTQFLQVDGIPGHSVTLHFKEHQKLIAFNPIVVRIKNFTATYHDPLDKTEGKKDQQWFKNRTK
uniref:Putative alpha-L-fucosidase n=1 Tax=Setaria digitata TaxID=48799 RepID=A0A915PTU5_9BILA